MKQRIAVVGGGSWGIALSITLADKGHRVQVWDLDMGLLEEMRRDRENKRYLPGVPLPDNLEIVNSTAESIPQADMILFAVPAQHFAKAFKAARPYMSADQVVVNVAKGIEQKSLMRMSQIAYEIWPEVRYCVLSGPSHAEEVGRKLPTTVVAASKDAVVASYVQDVFMTPRLRIYTNNDVTGVELGGALKNIIALGAGISDGMGFGDNAKAAMMTRGMAEIIRLGVKMGADVSTFNGLAGMGDLIVTCTSIHSRNRRCGMLIGGGMDPKEAVANVGMVVEGFYTTEAAYQLAQRVGVEMPITQAIYEVINGKLDAEEAVVRLMGRDRKSEIESFR